MTIFEKIKEEIMADSMNEPYTKKGIPPLFYATKEARLVVVGQAPGRKAEESRIFWNDASGDRLREWMGISREVFYGSENIAQLPMDFYYPGKGKSGDLPPRKGFAEKWHPILLKEMPKVETILLIGNYAQKYYLGKEYKKNLTETVRNYQDHLPKYLPLVHPSPLNFRWLNNNPWFEAEVVPILKEIVSKCLTSFPQ
jgi:uracil-DNA glycosylase